MYVMCNLNPAVHVSSKGVHGLGTGDGLHDPPSQVCRVNSLEPAEVIHGLAPKTGWTCCPVASTLGNALQVAKRAARVPVRQSR